MLFKTKSFVLASIFILILNLSFSQYTQFNHPTENLFQKGLFSLRQGDTLTAYQQIKSAYHFSPQGEDISFYYTLLSLALDKPNANKEAENWMNRSNNRIYNAQLYFQLGKFYFRHREDQKAIDAFNKTSISVLENNDIILMKYALGYLYFKNGDWDKSTNLLNSIRQLKSSKYYTDANYYAGFIALEKKDFTLALQCFQIAGQNNAYVQLVPFYISQIYYFLGDIESAMRTCENALKQKGPFYQIQLQQLMGHLLFEKKQYQQALPFLEYYVNSQKKVASQDLYQLSFCYYQAQDWLKAINGFKQLASVEDSLGQNSMYLLATSYLKVGDKQGAKNAFLMCWTKSINLSQKEVSLFNYAKLSIELKEYNAGIVSLEKFIDNYSNSIYLSEAKDLWITGLSYTNNFVQALDAYLTIEKPSAELLKIYPNILYGRACIFMNDGQLEQAYNIFTTLFHTPYNSNVLPYTQFWLGEIAYKMGKNKESIEYFESYLKDPKELDQISIKHANYNLGYGYMKSGSFQKAIEKFYASRLYIPLVNFENFQKDAFLRTADCHLMIKQYRQAQQIYQQIIDSNWSSKDYAILQKAIILGGLGKVNDKIKILVNFEQQYPNSNYLNDARIELADTYTNQEKFEEAILPLKHILSDKKAIEFYPQASYKLGLAYYNLNQNSLSINSFSQLLKEYPNSMESENAIEFVRNIFIEDQTPEKFVQFMNDFGKHLSVNEQDSLIFRAAVLKYDQKKYTDALNGFDKYLQLFPQGENQLEAYNFIAEIQYSKEQYDSAAKYFGMIADKSPNMHSERAALIAARLNYFNLKNFTLAAKYFTYLSQYATQKENQFEATKGLLRCAYKSENWSKAAQIAKEIINDKNAAFDDVQMANMSLLQNSLIEKDTSSAIQLAEHIIKSNSTLITAEAHYILATIQLNQNKLAVAEKTAFEIVKKQAAYEFWVTKSYILLGDIYVAQKDNFNAIATYKSVIENANIDSLKQIAQEKLKMISEDTLIKN